MHEINIELYPHEEKVNSYTHMPGILLGVLCLVLLMLKPTEDLSHKVSYVIYAVTFILLFMASTIYHGTETPERKNFLKKVDHAAIYLFMGGCYTPFVVVNMIGDFKYPFLAIVWVLVLLGIVYKFLSQYKSRFISIALYVAFGFFCFVVKGDFLDQIPNYSFWLLVLGGAFYIVGTLFYVATRIPYHHAIWHLFVLLGAMTHFYSIYRN